MIDDQRSDEHLPIIYSIMIIYINIYLYTYTYIHTYIYIYITAKLRISIFQITQLLVVDEWLGFPSSPPQQWGPSQQSAGPQ